MSNKLYTTLFLSFIGFCSFGQQQNINFNGKVTDEHDTPLLSVTIRLQKAGIGTISNQSGFFKLNLPEGYGQDTVLFSSIGYALKKIAVSEFSPGKINFVQLAIKAEILQGVIVKPVDPLAIIQAAIKNIPANYLNTAHITHGFYRMNTKKGNEHLSLSEAAFDILNYGYASSKGSDFNLIKNRYIKDEKGMYDLYYGVSPDQLYEADIIKEISSSDLLNKNGLKNHRFRLLKTIQYNNADTYVISFDQKDNIKESLYTGKLYIDVESLAFVAVDYRRSEKGIQYAKVGNASMRALMKLMGVSVAINSESNFVSYQKLNDKWLLSNVKNNTLLHCKSNRKFYDFPAKIQLDYVVTGIDIANILSFNAKETLGSKKLIEFQNTDAQADFWKDYNIILSDYNADSIAKNIIAKNESFNLKQQVEKKLKKFPKDKPARIDSILNFFHQKGGFTGSVLIKKDGKVILSKGYGLADKENNIAASENTQYRIGSLSKTFTSLLIMQLVEDNKLSLQDTIGKFLPTYIHKHINIQQLLSHTSGIPSYTNDMDKLLSVMQKEQSLKEIVSTLCSEPLEFTSGSQFHYSNSGYAILAAIIETITSKEYGQVLNEKIFIPLSMTQTSFGKNPVNSKGYYLGSIEPAYIIKNNAGAGGISSTVTDLLKWDEALKTDKLISQDILRQSFIPRAAYDDWDADYGFGWMIDKKMFGQSKSHKIIYHPGTDIGYYSMFVRQPDADNLIIMLSNKGDFPRFDLTDLILDEIN